MLTLLLSRGMPTFVDAGRLNPHIYHMLVMLFYLHKIQFVAPESSDPMQAILKDYSEVVSGEHYQAHHLYPSISKWMGHSFYTNTQIQVLNRAKNVILRYFAIEL